MIFFGSILILGRKESKVTTEHDFPTVIGTYAYYGTYQITYDGGGVVVVHDGNVVLLPDGNVFLFDKARSPVFPVEGQNFSIIMTETKRIFCRSKVAAEELPIKKLRRAYVKKARAG